MLMDVSIFDNLNTFIVHSVEISKNVVHGLRAIPDLIGNSFVTLSEFTEHCPPFITWIIMFLAGTGIILKVTKWG